MTHIHTHTHNRNTRKLTPKQELLDIISQEDLEKQRLLTTNTLHLWNFIYRQPVPVRRRLAQSVPYMAALYAIDIRKKWWPELEDFIFTDVHAAWHYQSQLRTSRRRSFDHASASNDIKERCDKLFSTSMTYAPKWLNDGQVKYPWAAGEAALCRTAKGIIAYLRSYQSTNEDAGFHRFPSAMLLKLSEYTSDPEFKRGHADWADSRLIFNFLRTYYPQGFAPLEPFILQDRRFHDSYIDQIIRGRWPLLEQWIEDSDPRLDVAAVQDYVTILARWNITIPRLVQDYCTPRLVQDGA